MRQLRPGWLVTVSAAAACCALLAGTGTAVGAVTGPAPAAVASGWGKAKVIPGPGRTSAQVEAMSCASPGNCAAGGEYGATTGEQAFVVSEAGGIWGKAIEVPGLGALNTGGDASIVAISCPSPGDCTAAGWYSVSNFSDNQVFAVTETNGTWGKAKQIPGTAALNAGDADTVFTLSCATPGNCSTGGSYLDAAGNFEAFADSQAGGIWGKAIEVPGTASLNTGGRGSVQSLSCSSAGNCTAAGDYSVTPGSAPDQAFVATQAGGTWGKARKLPGIATLSHNGISYLQSVSCGAAGDCSAIGTEWNGNTGIDQAFVAGQAGGAWGTPQIVPGITALAGEQASFTGPEDCFNGNCIAISCVSVGNCSATGGYVNGKTEAFVVTETGGTWGNAEQVPGIAALNVGGDAEFYAVSCGSAGNCSAGGYYKSSKTSLAPQQAFVVSETGGTWGKAIEVPGTAALNTGADALVYALSCASADCDAGGSYTTTTSGGAFISTMPAVQAAPGSPLAPGPPPSAQPATPARFPAPLAITAAQPPAPTGRQAG